MRSGIAAAVTLAVALTSSCLAHTLEAPPGAEHRPVTISARNRTCAIRGAGELWCWSTADGAARVPGIDDAIEVSMTADGPCVLRATGEVACGTPALPLVPVAGVANVTQLSAGTSRICALDDTDRVLCWGQRFEDGGVVDADPIAVPGLDDAVEIGVGWDFACARRRDGTIACWGQGEAGQLGDGLMTSSATPVAVSGLDHAAQIATGAGQACARRDDGSVLCWGQLASDAGTTARVQPTPTLVADLPVAIDVTAGYYTACATTADLDAWCWGLDVYGQLGDGASTSHDAPARVRGVRSVASVAPGHVHTCFGDTSGAVACAGHGFSPTSLVAVSPLP